METQPLEFYSLRGKPAPAPEYARRVEHVKKIVVKHPKFVEAFDQLAEVHELSKYSVISDNLYISGRTGVGKTTVLEEYAALFQRIQTKDRTIIPVLYVKVPPRAKSPKALASKILWGLGDILFDTGNEENMTQRIRNLVHECDIEMIILDEFQHLIDRDTDHVLATASDWLKTFAEEIKIPIVLCGLLESERIFEHNEQLDGRYSNRVKLEPFRFETIEEQREFRKFLKYIDKQLPFSSRSNIADPQRAAKIFYFSFGIPRYVKKLLEEATKSALRAGKDSIDDSNFEHAFHRITRSIRPYAINPFKNDSFDVHLAIQREREQEDKLFKKANDKWQKQQQ